MLEMNVREVEKILPEDVREQLRENAEKTAEMHFFCNVDEEDWPDDVWAKLLDAGDSYCDVTEVTGGAVVWEPFENYPAKNLLREMEDFADARYADALEAIGVYLAGTKKAA